MTDWQERISRGTPPAIRVEHEARYGLVASLIRGSSTWFDLGCGNGIAAAATLDGQVPSRTVLVDVDGTVARAAAREIGGGAIPVTADLASEPDLRRVIAAVLEEQTSPRIVTCFEVVEHLTTFVPLIGLISTLARDHKVDVVLSVPNDSFWAIENPHHRTMWGEGAFAELQRLLPKGAVVLKQVALGGTAIVPSNVEDALAVDLAPVVVDAARVVSTHMLIALGPRAAQLVHAANVVPIDLDEQRRWEREREAAASMVETVVALNAEQAEWFAEWRDYIHRLEQQLGLPLSGANEDESPPVAYEDSGGQHSSQHERPVKRERTP